MNKKREACKEKIGGGFFSGVLLLSGSTLLVKIIGLLYKIPLMRHLGAVGMGYFNSAYEIFAILCVIATSGLPLAVSLLISAYREAGRGRAIRRTFGIALFLFLTMGALGSAVLFFGAGTIARAIGNPDAAPSLRAIAPSLLTVCFCGAVRGYFQGYQRMGSTALSQLIEAAGKLLFGVGFASVAVRRGLSDSYVAAAAIWGVTLGTVLSALYLLTVRLASRFPRLKEEEGDGEPILRSLLRIALPITVSSLLLSLTRVIDMTLMLRRLQDIGYSVTEANAIYGSYTTLAVPVFSLIPSLIAPISLVLVPKLSAAIERGDLTLQERLRSNSLRVTVALAMPAALGIAAFSKPILSVLFGEEQAAVHMVAPMLSILGGSVLFSCMITVTNAILQSYRRSLLPMISLVIGVLVKGIFAYFFLGIPQIGAYGAPLSTLLCDVCIAMINLYFIMKRTPDGERGIHGWRVFFKPMLLASIAVLCATLFYGALFELFGSEVILLFGSVCVAALLYAGLCLWTKTVDVKELFGLYKKNRA